MINQAMIDQLTAQLAVYTPEWLASYDDSQDPNVLIGPSKQTAIIWTDTGFYQLNPIHLCPAVSGGLIMSEELEISFTDTTIGHTFALSKNYTPNTWNLYQQLYVEGTRSGLFFVDAPLERSIVTINNEDWEYTRVMRPGSANLGKTPFNRLQTADDIKNFWNTGIDDFYNIISAAINIASKNNQPGIPAITIKHRIADEHSTYFYKNFNLWDMNPTQIVNQSINIGTSIIKNIPVIGDSFSVEWADAARQKWSTLG
jgi:hypothetical protein